MTSGWILAALALAALAAFAGLLFCAYHRSFRRDLRRAGVVDLVGAKRKGRR